jgi:hypothetical protein
VTKSNLYSVLCTAVRLAAVYLFVDALLTTLSMVSNGHTTNDAAVWGMVLGLPAIQLLFGLLLWFFPGGLARVAANRRSLELFESDISPEVLQYVAFSVLGIWFAVTGLVQFAYSIHRWLFLNLYLDHHFPDPTSDPRVLGSLLSEIVKILAGLALAFGARGLVEMLRRFREAGMPKTTATETKPVEAES